MAAVLYIIYPLYNTIHAAYRQYSSRISRQVYKNM